MSNAVTVPADKLAELQRDAACWRWLVSQHNVTDLPIAQVVWKRGADPKGEWVNLIDGHDLTAHVTRAAGVMADATPRLSFAQKTAIAARIVGDCEVSQVTALRIINEVLHELASGVAVDRHQTFRTGESNTE